jgi:predicted nucleotidyltransferase
MGRPPIEFKNEKRTLVDKLAHVEAEPYLAAMNRDDALAILRAHETELRALGVERLSLFGSVARGDATAVSDVDVVVRLTPEVSQGGFAYFGRLEDLTERLREILGCPVDVIAEPVGKDRLRRNIEREATLAF